MFLLFIYCFTRSEAYSFSNWRLAYVIDLKLVDATANDIPGAIIPRFHGHSKFKQLILDFSSMFLISDYSQLSSDFFCPLAARFDLKLSAVPGFLDGSSDFRAIRRLREALVYYIQTCYFPVFRRAHLHVLHTIPMREKDHHLGLSSLKFQVIPFDCGDGEIYQGLFGRHEAFYERNMIAFLGMFSGHEIPCGWLPRRNWVCGISREARPCGTIVLSRETFLQAKILERLRLVNKQTTIVPHFSGVEDGELHLELTTWNEHRLKKDRKDAGAWKQINRSHESLDFEWNNKDEWRYQHIDDHAEAHYIVKAETHNAVSIPTVRCDVAMITVRGKTTLGLEFCGRDSTWRLVQILH